MDKGQLTMIKPARGIRGPVNFPDILTEYLFPCFPVPVVYLFCLLDHEQVFFL